MREQVLHDERSHVPFLLPTVEHGARHEQSYQVMGSGIVASHEYSSGSAEVWESCRCRHSVECCVRSRPLPLLYSDLHSRFSTCCVLDRVTEGRLLIPLLFAEILEIGVTNLVGNRNKYCFLISFN